MSKLKICRICLRTECKMYKFDQYELKSYYEQIMATEIAKKDALPKYLCFECATMLHKFHKFIEKCYIGLKSLKQILWKGPITYEAVHNVDRAQINLKSPLEILTVTKRVKTYHTKYAFDITNFKSEREEREVTEVINAGVGDVEVQYIGQDSMTDRDADLNPDYNYVDKKITDDEFEVKHVELFESEREEREVTQVINTKVEVEVQYVGQDLMTDRDADLDPDYNYIDENIKEDEFEVEDCKLLDIAKEDEVVEQQIDENKVKSPTTVFIDVEKEAVIQKSEKIKKRQKNFPKNGLKKSKPKYIKPKTKFLDMTSWKMSKFSEEEAIKSFKQRSVHPKYLAATYKCSDCFNFFSEEDKLKRHKLLRHSEAIGKKECRFCHRRYKGGYQLRKHMQQHYTLYECQKCDLVCNNEGTAKMHDDYHKGVVKKCVQCGEEFKHQTSYYSHLRQHRSQHICTLCGESFVSPVGLSTHRRVKHIIDEIIVRSDDDEEVGTFCAKCDIKFETRKAYQEHIHRSAMHTEQDAVTDGGAPPKVTEDTCYTKVKKPEEKISGGTLLKGSRLHKPRRLARKPTKCHQCGKEFPTQTNCIEHHKAEHPGIPFFNERSICEICGASVAATSMPTHLNIHTRKQIFYCDTCGRAFNTKSSLKLHILTHTGEKPYRCTVCDKRFTQSNSVKLHYRAVHLKQPYPSRIRYKKRVDTPPELTAYFQESNQGAAAYNTRSRVSGQDEPPPVDITNQIVTYDNNYTLFDS